MTAANKALLQIHFCVVLWGFTAILGKLITLPALALVWWRMTFVVAVLALFPRFWRAVRALPRRTMLIFAAIGVVVALHWLTFYGAIKLANASVAATWLTRASISRMAALGPASKSRVVVCVFSMGARYLRNASGGTVLLASIYPEKLTGCRSPLARKSRPIPPKSASQPG